MKEYTAPQVPKPGETIITVDTCDDDGNYIRSASLIKTGKDGLPLYSGILQGLAALERHIRIKQENINEQ